MCVCECVFILAAESKDRTVIPRKTFFKVKFCTGSEYELKRKQNNIIFLTVQKELVLEFESG